MPMFEFRRTVAPTALIAALAFGLASCAPKAPPPPPPPPPPPKVVVIPPKPRPPNNASDNLSIPPADANGLRYSINRDISPAQMLWNLRSAYNVAALNCSKPQHADILPRYKTFLTAHAKTLTATNKKVDAEFRAKHGAKFIAPRESYMTSVYNHFALPPTLTDFCDAVGAVTRDGAAVKSAELEAFAARSLPSIEVVFDDFYRRYEVYRNDLAIWQAQYGQPVTTAQPAISLPGSGTQMTGGAGS
ncbi:MAG: hypothetical protein Q8R81_10060 [Novosphingobium sp.]|uniref:hypothetical protein n=1 Tax=Novosphingobium sp. TaxID=1874826 RepID=UPI002733FC6B|nr:hypothetical protein [Novosphingobium sp.]MDP3550730.1 hypothetical protein [Novosphingobium sp.]